MNDAYQPLEVTPEQRANLQLLATYLLGAEVHDFDMVTFRSTNGTMNSAIEVDRYVEEHTCGTVGCAVGHGPEAGIAPLPTDKNWLNYATRAFGVEGRSIFVEGPLWSWCFDASWASTDNTARGAAKRIQIALTKGIPSNHIDQRWGDDALEYAP